MEGDANLGEEDLDVAPAETGERDLADLDEEVAHEETRLRVDPCKGHVVVLGLEVELLLPREEHRKPGDDG